MTLRGFSDAFKKASTSVLITHVLSPSTSQCRDLQKVSSGGSRVVFFALNMQNSHCEMYCEFLRVCALRHSCTCFLEYAEWLSCSQRALPQHLATSYEPCSGVSTTTRCRGKRGLHRCTLSLPSYKQPGRPGRAKRSFAFLAFMSFWFPELHCSSLGARLQMDAALILSGLSLPVTQFCPNPCLSLYQITCLSLFTSIFLPIAIHCSSQLPFWFTILCLCGMLSFLYLCYVLQAPLSYSFYLTGR